MNKPATKEPSMDEILSSIRQIIADEDQGEEPISGAAEGASNSQNDLSASLAGEAEEIEDEPITLSTDQMLSGSAELAEDDAGDEDGLLGEFNPVATVAAIEPAPVVPPEPEAPVLTIPDDVQDDEDDDEEALDLAEFGTDLAEDVALLEPDLAAPLVVADDIAFEEIEDEMPMMADAEPEFVDVPSPDPLPDPNLTSQMADELIAPATNAAVKSTMSKLSALSTITNGVTLDAMVREMMRPMLKEWLDENLPPMVERVVEREIARIARGE